MLGGVELEEDEAGCASARGSGCSTKTTTTELLDTAVRRGVAGGYVGGEPMATAATVSSRSRRWARGGRSGRGRGSGWLGFAEGGAPRCSYPAHRADGWAPRVHGAAMAVGDGRHALIDEQGKGTGCFWVGPALLPAGPSVHSVGFLVLLLSVFLSISFCFQLSFLSFIYY